MPKADQLCMTAAIPSPLRRTMSSAQYAQFAAKRAEADASVAALMDDIRIAARYLRKYHGYSLASFVECAGLHKNSLLRLNDPGWKPKPATLQKLDKLVVRAAAKWRGETFPGETAKRGRPRKAVN